MRPNQEESPGIVEGVCPQCREKGKAVAGQTVKAIIAVSLRTVREDTEYFFCRTQSCPVVYFSGDGKHTYTLDQVRERVYQKEPDNPDVLMCYCFQYTVGDIRKSNRSTQQAIITDINTGIKTGQCACDLRNPQGSCCLGNIRKLIQPLE
jgi:hypothetical protein